MAGRAAAACVLALSVLCSAEELQRALSPQGEVEARPAHASVGGVAVLDCLLDFPFNHEIPYHLQWDKDGVEIYSWYSGDDAHAAATEAVSTGWRGRVTREEAPGLGGGAVGLRGLRASDAGLYSCRVTFPNRSPPARRPPTYWRLYVDGDDLIVSPPLNATVREGEFAELECTPRDPAATVSWTKDDEPLQTDERVMMASNGSVVVTAAAADDAGRYECLVAEHGGPTHRAKAYLDVQCFFCKDPDTGKLYPANSTWPSTTFCGSYMCKLKKRNITRSEINNDFWKHTNFGTKKITTEKDTNLTKVIPLPKENITRQEIELLLQRSQQRSQKQSQNIKQVIGTDKKIQESNTLDEDRYLSDAEIKTLSVILKSMKKSDLEAMLEVYSLAQDIYKELDKDDDDENIALKAFKTIDTNKKAEVHKDVNSLLKKVYWYEPQKSDYPKDLNLEGSDQQPQIIIAHPFVHIHNPNPPKPQAKDTATYFTGIVNPNVFEKLPYYYPMTNFQRVASYVHSPGLTYPPTDQVYTPPMPVPVSAPTVNSAPKNAIPHTCHHAHAPQNPAPPAPQNLAPPAPAVWPNVQSIQMPYPFRPYHKHPQLVLNLPREQNSIVNEDNNNYLPSNPYRNNVWQYFGIDRQEIPYAQPYIPIPAAQLQNAILVNPENIYRPLDIKQIGKETKTTIIPNALANSVKPYKDVKLLPQWRTEELSENVLRDIKGNVNPKIIPFPLRKKVKLERVGKVIKLDEITRHKRATETPNKENELIEEYEVVLLKSTCQTETEPGFFRVGNSTAPFPGCCPQRINS